MRGMLKAIGKKHYKLLLSLAIITALGFGMTAGLICGFRTLKRSLEDYVSKYHYPNAVITTQVTDVSEAERLREIKGVRGCDARLFIDTAIRDDEGKNLTVRVFSFTEEERQGFVYWSLSEDVRDSMFVEYKFAKNNGINEGDTIEFRIQGGYWSCKVGGIISRPETLATKMSEDSWGINYDFGYVYVPVTLLKKGFGKDAGYDKLCNEFLLYFDDGVDAEAVLKEAVRSFPESEVKNSYVYAESAVKKRIDDNLDPIRTIMVILPIAFFAIVLIVVFLLMSMIIQQSRREIGILRALGFTQGQVKRMFRVIGLLVCAVGVLPGVLIAAGITLYVGNYFKDFFPLPDLTYDVGFLSIVISTLAVTGVTLTATLLSAGQISKIMPYEAMTRQTRTMARIPRFMRPVIKTLRPMGQVTVTTLLRSKGRFMASTVCMAASATIIYASFAFIASKNYTLHQIFEERLKNDCQIFFEELPAKELKEEMVELGYVDQVEEVTYYQTSLLAKGKSAQVIINGLTQNGTLIGITDASGRELRVKQGGIVLERHVADELGICVGDTLTFEGKDLTVTDLSDQCVNRIQYVSIEDADFLPKPDMGCLVCKLNGDRKQELLAFLLNTEGYVFAVFTDSLYNYNTELYATYDFAAWLVIVFAMAIGFVIVFNTMLTNLHENRKELAILRNLGFQHREISRSRLMQSVFQLMLACFMGFPLGVLMARFGLASISTPMTEYVYVGGVAEFLFTGGLLLAYVLISHASSMRLMKKWDINEIIKDRE